MNEYFPTVVQVIPLDNFHVQVFFDDGKICLLYTSISKFSTEGDYLDSDEVYQALTDYLIDYLKTDTNFSKLLYKRCV